MPEYIQYDTQGTIINKWYSVDYSVVEGKPNILEVPRDLFRSLTKFHIVDNGVVREMTQEEKDALDLAEEQARKQKLLEAIDKYDISNLDLLTALVKRINIRIPSNPITKQEIIDEIKNIFGL